MVYDLAIPKDKVTGEYDRCSRKLVALVYIRIGLIPHIRIGLTPHTHTYRASTTHTYRASTTHTYRANTTHTHTYRANTTHTYRANTTYGLEQNYNNNKHTYKSIHNNVNDMLNPVITKLQTILFRFFH